MKAVSVQLEGIIKRFGRVAAVERADLELPAGARVTLLGRRGRNPAPAYLRDITMVFQGYALFPHRNVFENIAYGLKVQRRPQAEVEGAGSGGGGAGQGVGLVRLGGSRGDRRGCPRPPRQGSRGTVIRG